jgi:hypothetical protein
LLRIAKHLSHVWKYPWLHAISFTVWISAVKGLNGVFLYWSDIIYKVYVKMLV